MKPRRILRLAPIASVALLLISGSACSSISVRIAMNKGVSHYKAKEYEQAAEKFREAAKLDPAYAEAYLDLGLTYMSLYEPGSTVQKDLDYAEGGIGAFRKFLELQPDHPKAREYLVNICNSAKRMPDAIEYFMTLYNRKPKDLEVVRTIGALWRMAGDQEKALEWYEKSAELDPTNPEAYYSIGVACWARSYNGMDLEYSARMTLIDKGLAALDKAVQLKNDYYEALSYVSLLYREKAKYDISPAAAVGWRQKADETLAKVMEIRNKVLAAAAAAAAKAAGDTRTPVPGAATPAGGTSIPAGSQAKPGGE